MSARPSRSLPLSGRVLVLVAALVLAAGVVRMLASPEPPEAVETPPVSAEVPASETPEVGAPAEGAPAPEVSPDAIPMERLLAPKVAEPDPLQRTPRTAPGSPDPSAPKVSDRLEVEQRSSVSHRGTRVEDTDVTMGVPVGKDVEVKGGVRVQQRDTKDEPQSETTPTVGIKVDY